MKVNQTDDKGEEDKTSGSQLIDSVTYVHTYIHTYVHTYVLLKNDSHIVSEAGLSPGAVMLPAEPL